MQSISESMSNFSPRARFRGFHAYQPQAGKRPVWKGGRLGAVLGLG